MANASNEHCNGRQGKPVHALQLLCNNSSRHLSSFLPSPFSLSLSLSFTILRPPSVALPVSQFYLEKAPEVHRLEAMGLAFFRRNSEDAAVPASYVISGDHAGDDKGSTSDGGEQLSDLAALSAFSPLSLHLILPPLHYFTYSVWTSTSATGKAADWHHQCCVSDLQPNARDGDLCYSRCHLCPLWQCRPLPLHLGYWLVDCTGRDAGIPRVRDWNTKKRRREKLSRICLFETQVCSDWLLRWIRRTSR